MRPETSAWQRPPPGALPAPHLPPHGQRREEGVPAPAGTAPRRPAPVQGAQAERPSRADRAAGPGDPTALPSAEPATPI